MTFALLRRASVPLVPPWLTISPRVALLKTNGDEEQKICKSGNKKRGRQWCLVPFDSPPWEGEAGEGEKIMACLYRFNRRQEIQLWSRHLSNVYLNNAKCLREMGESDMEKPPRVVDHNLYLVMDGHTAGCVGLENFCHPVGEPLILQLGLLFAVLLLLKKAVT